MVLDLVYKFQMICLWGTKSGTKMSGCTWVSINVRSFLPVVMPIVHGV